LSEGTERNAASSRSHAICTLYFDGTTSSRRSLRLIDLAGSEGNYETRYMSARQHKEFSHINLSLMALKGCFRAYAAEQSGVSTRIPFRQSQLTHLLQDCFLDKSHCFVVVAAVSPAAVDVVHTVNTLRHATRLKKNLSDKGSEVDVHMPINTGMSEVLTEKPIMEWTNDDVMLWLSQAENGRFAHLVVPPNITGEQLLSMSSQGLASLFEGMLGVGRGVNEGEAWAVRTTAGGVYNEGDQTGGGREGVRLGRALFAAARRVAFGQNILAFQ